MNDYYDEIQEIACAMDPMEAGFFLAAVSKGEIKEEELLS